PRGEVSLTVTLPAALQGASFTPSRGTYNPATGIWTFPANDPLDFAGAARNNTATLTVGGTIDPAATGNLSVTAMIDLTPNARPTQVDTISGNNSAADTDTLTPRSVPPVPTPPAPVPGPPAALSVTGALVSRGRRKPKQLVFRIHFSDGTLRE